MLKEFKTFIIRGNVLDLAIGFVIGAAFGKIITSLVNDVLMPPIGLILGRASFSNLFINLSRTPYATIEEAKRAGAPTINYGLFINSLIDFLIVAFVFFILLKQINRLKGEPPPSTKECPYCASAIAIKASRCPQCTSDLQTSSSAQN